MVYHVNLKICLGLFVWLSNISFFFKKKKKKTKSFSFFFQKNYFYFLKDLFVEALINFW
jgi:hypothetical protein